MLFKLTFDKEIHIVNAAKADSLLKLKETIIQIFKQLPKRFYLTYLDEDSDEITLENGNDFTILLKNTARSIKIFIREQSEEFYD
jgi:threonyl-tRNA synthetase